jgi:hypothetical protein
MNQAADTLREIYYHDNHTKKSGASSTAALTAAMTNII